MSQLKLEVVPKDTQKRLFWKWVRTHDLLIVVVVTIAGGLGSLLHSVEVDTLDVMGNRVIHHYNMPSDALTSISTVEDVRTGDQMVLAVPSTYVYLYPEGSKYYGEQGVVYDVQH